MHIPYSFGKIVQSNIYIRRRSLASTACLKRLSIHADFTSRIHPITKNSKTESSTGAVGCFQLVPRVGMWPVLATTHTFGH